MKDYARKLLEKAQDAIEAAEGLTNMGKTELNFAGLSGDAIKVAFETIAA